MTVKRSGNVGIVVEDLPDTVARLRARSATVVDEVVRDQDSYRLCCVRGPEGILIELAEALR